MANGERLGLLSQESGISPSGGLLTRTRLVRWRTRSKNPDGSWGHWSNYADESTPDIDESTLDVQEDPKNIGREGYYKKETHRTKLPVAPGQVVETGNPEFFMHGEFKDVRDLMPEHQPRDYGMQYFHKGENYRMPQYEPDPSLRNEESERGHVYGGLGKPPKPLIFEKDMADEIVERLIKEKHKSLISPSDLERLEEGKKLAAGVAQLRAEARIGKLLKNPEQF